MTRITRPGANHRAYHVLQETLGATPGDQTWLSDRVGRVHLDTTCTTGQVRAKPPGSGSVDTARRAQINGPNLRVTPCAPGVTRPNAGRSDMTLSQAGRVHPEATYTTGRGSGQAPGPRRCRRSSKVLVHQVPTFGSYHVRRESLGAATPGDRAWSTAGLGRDPPGDAAHGRTGLGSSSRTPEASTQLGWPRITKAELRDIACTPGDKSLRQQVRLVQDHAEIHPLQLLYYRDQLFDTYLILCAF